MSQQTSSKFGYRSTAEEVAQGHDLSGKTVIVTGASSGLGIECARVLALKGAKVLMGVRDTAKGQAAIEQIRAQSPDIPANNLELVKIDLASFESVRQFAKEFTARNVPLNYLLCNGAIMAVPFALQEGYESQFATNHLGHFLLASLLTPALIAGAPSRLVVVSSIGHKRCTVDFDDINFEKKPYQKWQAYAQSKSANALFAREYNRRYSPKGVTAYSLHPGGIMTGLQSALSAEEHKAMGWVDENGKLNEVFKTVPEGSSTSIYCMLQPGLESEAGEYFEDCARSTEPATSRIAGSADHIRNDDDAKRLWDLSEQITKCKL